MHNSTKIVTLMHSAIEVSITEYSAIVTRAIMVVELVVSQFNQTNQVNLVSLHRVNVSSSLVGSVMEMPTVCVAMMDNFSVTVKEAMKAMDLVATVDLANQAKLDSQGNWPNVSSVMTDSTGDAMILLTAFMIKMHNLHVTAGENTEEMASLANQSSQVDHLNQQGKIVKPSMVDDAMTLLPA